MKPVLAKCKLIVFSIACSTLISLKSHAQSVIIADKLEVGLNFGPTFFLGDLGGNAGKGTYFLKDLNLELTKVMKGAYISFYPNTWLGFRLAGQLTYVEGRDNIINTNGVDELWRKQRNLDFRSKIWEVYSAIELFPLDWIHRNDDEYNPTFRPYGFIGAGIFNFNPEGSITDRVGNTTWHKLHPLKTEGQGMAEYPDKKPYKLTQLNIPLGGGLKINIGERFTTSFELLYRKTFTDYIDDVSTTYIDPDMFDRYLNPDEANIARLIHDKTIGIVTQGVSRYEPGTQRGNSHNNDAYFSLLIKLGIKLGSGNNRARGGGRMERNASRQMKCPHVY